MSVDVQIRDALITASDTDIDLERLLGTCSVARGATADAVLSSRAQRASRSCSQQESSQWRAMGPTVVDQPFLSNRPIPPKLPRRFRISCLMQR